MGPGHLGLIIYYAALHWTFTGKSLPYGGAKGTVAASRLQGLRCDPELRLLPMCCVMCSSCVSDSFLHVACVHGAIQGVFCTQAKSLLKSKWTSIHVSKLHQMPYTRVHLGFRRWTCSTSLTGANNGGSTINFMVSVLIILTECDLNNFSISVSESYFN